MNSNKYIMDALNKVVHKKHTCKYHHLNHKPQELLMDMGVCHGLKYMLKLWY